MMIIKILKAIDVAFSMYSKVPMPRFEWESDDMKYHLCFFPFVGALNGIIFSLWWMCAGHFEIGQIMYVMLAIAIPLLITGGFHLDGFMDTMDAIHSYQDRQRKLEILKDPHIGAFSVISLVAYLALLIGFLSEIDENEAIYVLSVCFFTARALSGISVIYFKPASEKGMLQTSRRTADKKLVGAVLIIELIVAVGFMAWLSPIFMCLSMSGQAVAFIYYYIMSYREFGGITGDLAGYFVVISELVSVIMISIGCIIF